MLSVRIAAAGAVIVATLSLLTSPVRACDDRFVKRCEKASAAAAVAAENAAEAPVARKKSARQMRAAERRAARIARRSAPRFSVRSSDKPERGMVLASGDSRMVKLPAESALTRRFRGFVDPQPMASNFFEALRKPHPLPINFEPAETMRLDTADVSLVGGMTPGAVGDATAAAVRAARQDKARPAPTEVPVVASNTGSLADALTVKQKPKVEVAAAVMPQVSVPQVSAAQMAQPAMLTEAPQAAPAPTGFPVHQLVIALCGALGAAGALRLIVGT